MTINDDVENIVLHVLADEEIQNTELYIKSGRRYAKLDAEELSNEYARQYEIWGNNPHDQQAMQNVQDIASEHALRQQTLPADRIYNSHQKIIEYISTHKDDIFAQHRDEISDDIFEKYNKLMARQNKA